MCKRCKRQTAGKLTAILAACALLSESSRFYSNVTAVPSRSTFETFAGKQPKAVESSGPALLIQSAQASTVSSNKTTKWTCPMHPHYIADAFGPCPICGMDLVKLETGGPDLNAQSAEMRTAITISPEVIQNIGVRLSKVERARFGRQVRSYGIVEANRRLQTEITARVEGWVERLHVTAVGDRVEAGTKLFELYSPQLVVSQNDYLNISGMHGTSQRGFAQLRAFGVQRRAIEMIRRRNRPVQWVPFYAESEGVITKLALRQGSYTRRGMPLFMIQNYSSVWVRVSVAEKDLRWISKTTPATVIFPNLTGKSVNAKIDYIHPTVNTKTRTGRVRLVIDNPDGKLRPGSYADVTFEVDGQHRTAVPSQAVLESGDGQYVVVSQGQGRFKPRLIETGLASERWTEVTKGLQLDEDIVVSGQFLLDSESALRESFQKLQRLQLPLSLLKLSKNQLAMVDYFVDAAIYLHEARADGYEPVGNFFDPAISVRDLMWLQFKNTKLAFILNDAAKALRACP